METCIQSVDTGPRCGGLETHRLQSFTSPVHSLNPCYPRPLSSTRLSHEVSSFLYAQSGTSPNCPLPPQICGRASSRRFQSMLSMLSGLGAPLGRLSSARALTAAEAPQRNTFTMRQLVLQRQLPHAGAESSLRLPLTRCRRFKDDPVEEECPKPKLRLPFPCSGPRGAY